MKISGKGYTVLIQLGVTPVLAGVVSSGSQVLEQA